jgi:hypothetical protein
MVEMDKFTHGLVGASNVGLSVMNWLSAIGYHSAGAKRRAVAGLTLVCELPNLSGFGQYTVQGPRSDIFFTPQTISTPPRYSIYKNEAT